MNINLNNIFEKKEENNFVFKEMIINNLKKRNKDKLNQYKLIFKSCIALIKKSISDNQTDILFTVSSTIPNCPDYDPNECLKYISNKIIKNKLNTYIIDSNNIFITWKNIKL